MKVVLFLGYSGSGKTTAIEEITKALVRKGLKVGTLKHIHHDDFTMDTPGKDTWRHGSAGASITVALAPHELTIISRRDTADMQMDRILEIFTREEVDFTLVEGFYRRLTSTRDIIKILCARDKKEALELASQHPTGITCVTGIIAERSRVKRIAGIPVMRIPRDADKVSSMLMRAPSPNS